MINFIPGHNEHEISRAFSKEFGIDLKKSQIKNFKTRFGIKSGTQGGTFYKGQPSHNKGQKMPDHVYQRAKATMFKKGNIPHNHKPVGSERLNVDGYIEVKIAEPAKWKLKQRLIWEKRTGEKLTSKDVIIFLDGNKQNFDIDNLVKLTRAELVRYNQDHLYDGTHDVSLAAASIAKIKVRLKKNREVDR